MPRPTAAQLAYGSCTVIFSTLAMLLLSQTSSGAGIAVIAVAALLLGLLVAMTVPMPKRPPAPAQRPVADVAPPMQATPARKPVREPVRESTAS
ncbi:hypothetical protein SSP24_70180 [Streptomyces spinoverrucosus]|uniref:Uncharacterized protein n=1 Tax=Streptomyces spinoverrucosus TaxID=284043 RepID=A0A4Y3VRV8_9ACTN|nr:hypothetical protein [Streptomyces spinoverrucosus]GEC09363.1 hypothetical protein SSP24_70180 [Streptomyces spinoverrucosus]GHB70185.1 hypothetical protein GCM10010397_45460 [Streptomyces spinoverrucosus]